MMPLLSPSWKKILIFLLMLLLFQLVKLAIFGTFHTTYIVITGAMEPTYNVGDLVITRKVALDDLQINDVIIHDIDQKNPALMRVVSIDYEARIFTTKGDHNQASAPWQTDLPETSIKAKPVTKIPLLGYVELYKILTIAKLVLFYLAACLSMEYIDRRVART